MRTSSIRHRFARVIAFALLVLVIGCQRAAPPASRPQPGTAASVDSTAPAPDTSGDPAAIVRDYYRAIQDHRYEDAYGLWGSGGAASGKTLAAFRAGFAGTASVEVELGTTGRVEGAAGSRYVEIPVRITAAQTDGTRQAFTGQYTLRRSVVDGATPEQRAWRIYSASIRRL